MMKRKIDTAKERVSKVEDKAKEIIQNTAQETMKGKNRKGVRRQESLQENLYIGPSYVLQ